MRILLPIFTLLLFLCLSCGSRQLYVPDFSEEINYSYCETVYMGSTNDKNNIVDKKYYNNKKQLIEHIGHEFRSKYTYDTDGKLTEIWNCRMYNCETGYKEILKYDDNGNYLGTIIITSTHPNAEKLDTVKFYDKFNHCIKERTESRNDAYGDHYECWKYYTYENDRLIGDRESRYGGEIWTTKYSYDEKSNLIAIERTCNDKYENEIYEYNSKGLLIKETIDGNEYPVDNNTIFSVKQNSTTYEYDTEGRLTKKLVYNHKGTLTNSFTHFYENKK
jgi:YD repeat-containing protein